MNLTIEQVITEIVTEVGGDTTDDDFAAIMLVFFKSGIRKFPTFIRDRLLLVIEELTLSSGDQSLDLTTLTKGFLKENHVWWVGTNDNRLPIIPPPYREYFNRIYNTSGVGKPIYYVINEKTMLFEKKTDQDITVGIEFFKEISNVSTTDLFFGDERTLEACKELCKQGYFLDYEEDERKSVLHGNESQRLLIQLEADYEDQEMGGHIGKTRY